MEIKTLLKKCGLVNKEISGNVLGISTNSKDVKDKIFLAIKGLKYDGHDYIEEALKNGALAVISERENKFSKKIILTKNTRFVFSKLASIFYNYDPEKMICIGITGTNGKTTSSYMLKNMLAHLGIEVGIIGTIGSNFGNHQFETNLTTPDASDIHKILHKMESLGCKTCVMEASSHAIAQFRVAHIDFKCSIFTNLSQDHLDYHKNMEEYFKTKAKIFSKKNISIINTDCRWGKILSENLNNKITFGTQNQDVVIKNIKPSIDKTQFEIHFKNKIYKKTINLTGAYNATNFAGCFAACVSLGHRPEDILGVNIEQVPGRMELFLKNNVYFFIDYSHTEDALRAALKSLNEVKRKKIITVFGCGGDRDIGKRTKMARVSEVLSDYTIVTSDNPRYEDPLSIMENIKSGFSSLENVEFIESRRMAIKRAVNLAKQDDIVLVAGKGHESYQSVKGKKIELNDKAVILDE